MARQQLVVRAHDVAVLLEHLRNRPLHGNALDAFERLDKLLHQPILGHPADTVSCRCGKETTHREDQQVGPLEAPAKGA